MTIAFGELDFREARQAIRRRLFTVLPPTPKKALQFYNTLQQCHATRMIQSHPHSLCMFCLPVCLRVLLSRDRLRMEMLEV